MSTPPVPFSKLESYDKLQFSMIRVHDGFKAGFDSIIQHLEKPPLDDLPNFVGYCTTWAASIASHHDTEELLMFPFLSKHLDMSSEAEEHAVMHRALDDLLAFLRDPTASDKTAFNADALRAKMAALKEPLYAHLDAEVAHIAGENLQAFTRAELEDLMAQIGEHAHKHADPTTELPFMLSHIAPPYHGHYPEMPWLVRKVLVPVFAFRHRGYWKYSPYPVA